LPGPGKPPVSPLEAPAWQSVSKRTFRQGRGTAASRPASHGLASIAAPLHAGAAPRPAWSWSCNAITRHKRRSGRRRPRTGRDTCRAVTACAAKSGGNVRKEAPLAPPICDRVWGHGLPGCISWASLQGDARAKVGTMRFVVWCLLYAGAAALSWQLFLIGLGYGIGGCDVCADSGYHGLCWFCTELGQIAYLALAASPMCGLALLQFVLRHRRRAGASNSDLTGTPGNSSSTSES
jgi:hypothetical protein